MECALVITCFLFILFIFCSFLILDPICMRLNKLQQFQKERTVCALLLLCAHLTIINKSFVMFRSSLLFFLLATEEQEEGEIKLRTLWDGSFRKNRKFLYSPFWHAEKWEFFMNKFCFLKKKVIQSFVFSHVWHLWIVQFILIFNSYFISE